MTPDERLEHDRLDMAERRASRNWRSIPPLVEVALVFAMLAALATLGNAMGCA